MPPGTRQIEMTWRCSSCSHRNLGRHTVCQQCGNPKDAGERYEMPSDTASAATVTDESLLRMATGGANWRCEYCGSDQRRADGNCGQCGAAPSNARPRRRDERKRKRDWTQRVLGWIRAHPYVSGAVGLVLVLLLTCAWMNRTRHYEAKTAAAQWTQSIIVERYQIWRRDGWRGELPSGAFEVSSLGQQIHHYEQVLDGYDTQRYSEQVACGEDCRDVPERCSESCSDNGNGFATCRTTCSGGGRSCSTKYCTEWRTREVPRYRQEPRYAERVRYDIWDWGVHRTLVAAGAGIADLRWPVEEARLGLDLAERQEERETRTGSYRVTLAYDDDERIEVEVTAHMYAGFADGSPHELTIAGDDVWVDGVAVTVVPKAE